MSGNDKLKVATEELKKVGEGKLSSQGTGTFPNKGRAAAKWLEGDVLSYWVDPKNNHMIVVNETLNEPITIQSSLFNDILREKFNGEAQVIILEGDYNNRPGDILTNYIREYDGHIDPKNPEKGKIYLDEVVINSLNKDEEGRFLKEYSRYVSEQDFPGAYIFDYHRVNIEGYHVAIESALRSGDKIILCGYHNSGNIIKKYLEKLKISEYMYLRFKTGEDAVMKLKKPNSEEVLVVLASR